MRHEKAELLLRVAFDMQASPAGLTLENIASDYGQRLSRRTAERLRDAIARLFPGHFEEVAPGTLPKRWRLRRSWLQGLAGIDHESLEALALAQSLLEQSGRASAAEALGRLQRGVLAAGVGTPETDLESLAVAEGIAVRFGEASVADVGVMDTLRRAIRQGRQVELRYHYSGSGLRRTLQLHPYGLLLGQPNQLVASRDAAGAPKSYSVDAIHEARLLETPLVRPRGFSLDAFSRHAGGGAPTSLSGYADAV